MALARACCRPVPRLSPLQPLLALFSNPVCRVGNDPVNLPRQLSVPILRRLNSPHSYEAALDTAPISRLAGLGLAANYWADSEAAVGLATRAPIRK